MTLHDPQLRALYDLKLFVQCDSDLMLARRIKRDVAERGRNMEGVLEQYLRFVKPSFDNFVQPSSKFADIIVPGHDNAVAIDLITTHIRKELDERSVNFRQSMARDQALSQHRLIFENYRNGTIIVLPQTPQLKCIYTILRDASTSRSDFIFFADRLATLVIEKAMEQLPFRPHMVVTPVDVEAEGKILATDSLCGISIRSGGPLEHGLTRVIRDVALGSFIIQTDPESGEPLLLYSSLPRIIRERHQAENAYVFLLDTQIVTGASGMMAIRILLDHGVREDHIIFATFIIAAGGGVATIRNAFPGVRIVTGVVDDKVVESWDDEDGRRRRVWGVEPGMGHISDRYF